MKQSVRIILVSAFAIAVAACARNAGNRSGMMMPGMDENAIPKVTVTTVVVKDVVQDEVYSSTVQAYVVNNVVPQSGSRIKKINVEIGDFVSKGQVLAEMEQVNLTQARLKLINDSTELRRMKGLLDEGGISQSDYEAIELAYKVSRSSYENLLENTILRSPVNGVITARNYDQGDMYAMSSPIYVVQQITPVKLLVGISESEYTKVHKGDAVTVETDAIPGRTFDGRVNRIYPTIDPASHTFTAEVLVNNYDRVLRPGMYAKVRVLFGVNHSIVVPDDALVKLQGSGQRSIYVLNDDGTVSNRPVEMGRRSGGECEILSGLEEGERIVVSGQNALKDGSQVEVIG